MANQDGQANKDFRANQGGLANQGGQLGQTKGGQESHPGRDGDVLAVHDRPEGARLSVQVKPRASRTHCLGVRDGALIVAVTAPPVDGEANAALVRAVAEILGVAARDVTIASGHGSKRKIVDVRGMNAAAVLERLRLPA